MKKFMGRCLLMLPLLAGCHDLSGSLKVSKFFSLMDLDGRSQELLPGNYHGFLSFKKNPNALEVTTKNVATGDKVSARFQIPYSELNGKFFIYAEESGQKVDLQGELRTDVADGPVVKTYQSCVRHIGRGNHSGRKRVEYFDRETLTTLRAQLIEAAGNSQVAEVEATHHETERKFVYRGPCS